MDSYFLRLLTIKLTSFKPQYSCTIDHLVWCKLHWLTGQATVEYDELRKVLDLKI